MNMNSRTTLTPDSCRRAESAPVGGRAATTPGTGRRAAAGDGARRAASAISTATTLRAAMDLSLFFAGTAGSAPTARRGLPALLVRRGGDRVLFDCGEGTQRQLVRSIGLSDITDVFITHL